MVFELRTKQVPDVDYGVKRFSSLWVGQVAQLLGNLKGSIVGVVLYIIFAYSYGLQKWLYIELIIEIAKQSKAKNN